MSLIISNSTGFFFIRRIDDAAAHLRGGAPITPSGNAFHYSWKKGDLSMQKTGCREVSVGRISSTEGELLLRRAGRQKQSSSKRFAAVGSIDTVRIYRTPGDVRQIRYRNGYMSSL